MSPGSWKDQEDHILSSLFQKMAGFPYGHFQEKKKPNSFSVSENSKM